MAIKARMKADDASRRGVSPIIATMMLVAIAVVGGVIVYTYFQNIAGKTQIQASNLSSISMLGYDARQVNPVLNHLGGGITGANNSTGITYIALYIKNNNALEAQISKVYVNGGAYNFNATLTAAGFRIVSGLSGVDTINASETGTLLIKLNSAASSGQTLNVIVETMDKQQFKFNVVAGSRIF